MTDQPVVVFCDLCGAGINIVKGDRIFRCPKCKQQRCSTCNNSASQQVRTLLNNTYGKGSEADRKWKDWAENEQSCPSCVSKKEMSVSCRTCGGSGGWKCDKCKGEGKARPDAWIDGFKKSDCKKCAGTGKVKCHECGGTGKQKGMR